MDNFNVEEIERATQAKRAAAAARPSKFLPKAKARPIRAPAHPQPPTEEALEPAKEQEAAEERTKLAEAVERAEPAGPAEPVEKAERPASTRPLDKVQPAEPASSPQSPQPRSDPTSQVPKAAAEGTPERARAEKLCIVPVAHQISTAATQGSGSDETDSDAEKKPKRRKRIATGKKVKSTATERKLTAEEMANVDLNPRDPILKYVQRAQAQERLRAAEQKRRRAEGEDMEEDQKPLALEAPPPQAQPASGGAIEFELVDGRMVPKQQSLVIQAQAAQVHGPVTEYKNVVNNLSYSKRMSSERWSAEETEMFFQAIQTFGTDFELISRLFPGRQRKALANKWRRESKANPDRVNAVYNRTGDISKMQKLVEALAGGEGVERGESNEEDGKLGGMLAADLFPEASQALVPVSSSQAAGDSEEPSATPPAKRGRGRGRGASKAREQSQPSTAAQSQRRGTSRRKRQPAQSVPVDHVLEPAKAGRRTSGRRTKQREAVLQTKETAAVSQGEESS